MASTFLQRTNELRSSGKSAIEAARQARDEANKPNTIISKSIDINSTPKVVLGPATTTSTDGVTSLVGSNQPFIEESAQDTSGNIVGVGGNVLSTKVPSTQKVEPPTQKYTSDPVDSQGNSSTIKGTSINKNNKNTVIEGATNTVLGDTVDNYKKNAESDRIQLENKRLAIESNKMEVDTELKRKKAEDEALALEEDKIQKQKAEEDRVQLQMLQDKEREQNAAEVAALQAKNESEERELKIQNDIALSSSNAALGRLGLTLSTAGVATAQKIHTDGLYNLAKLKTENAYNLGKLRVEVAKVEFDHTTAINKIVNDSAEKSRTIRKALNESAHTIQNSIIENRLSRVTALDAIIDKYKTDTKANEVHTIKQIKDAATALDDVVKSLYDSLKTKESFGQDKINIYATSGEWFKMTPAKRLEAEQLAGLPKGTVLNQIKANLGKGIASKLEGIPGLNSAKIGSLVTEAVRLMNVSGYGMEVAMQMALTTSPEYQKQLALAEAKKNKVGGGGSSASGKTYSKIIVDRATNESYNVIFDKETNQQLASTPILRPEQSTSYDTSGGVVAGIKALSEGKGLSGAAIAAGSTAIKGQKTTTKMVPLKPKAVEQASEWEIK